VPCDPMARETVYILQSYIAGRGKTLKAEPQVGCATAEEARRKAKRLAPLRLGVVAFAASADIEMGEGLSAPLAHGEGARRLADPRAMGQLFKMMAVTSPGCPALPGLARA